ncbi:MAG: hypothetical protein A2017_09460 [Lentisphaerae bacterium GWF2_44_16]|nr:MAG: hypothetical protein A2017_09460 [Lentisphaerae bacterium GWF2_44_16]
MERIIDNVEFKVVKTIAEGGMGTVYKAMQKGVEGFEKTVAIKTLLPGLSRDQKFIDMFIDEAKLVANLVHENIVQIYQLGKSEGSYYFVLEFVSGISLHEFQEFHNKIYVQMPQELAVFITSRIARGLAYAHSRLDQTGKPLKIVHCDVCPFNILITTEGLPKLTDFGIARAANLAQDNDSISGKLPFMSPEQAEGNDLDFRSDIYSLGIVLFYMLTGNCTRDITADFDQILLAAVENHIDWDKLPLGFDNDLLKILKKMMAKNPDDRYSTTQELARELEYFIYRNGYGPTIVTLSEYMRKQMPYLFAIETPETGKQIPGKHEKTMKISF